MFSFLVWAWPQLLGQIDLGVADKLAGGTVEYVLAVVVVVQAAVVAFLFKRLLDEIAGRRADQKEHHAETVGMLTAVVTLNVKTNDSFDVLEDAIDLAERQTAALLQPRDS